MIGMDAREARRGELAKELTSNKSTCQCKRNWRRRRQSRIAHTNGETCMFKLSMQLEKQPIATAASARQLVARYRTGNDVSTTTTFCLHVACVVSSTRCDVTWLRMQTTSIGLERQAENSLSVVARQLLHANLE